LPFSLGSLEKHLDLPDRFGLCGGMSFAAADFFLANFEPPGLDAPPAQGHPLYDYLYSRQIDSLGQTLELVPKFAKWMALPDLTSKGTAALTHAALPDIITRIESGQPTLLGLVLTSTAHKGQLWQNHQVLAYAAEKSAETLLIHIYDPNFPRADDAALRVTPIDAGDGAQGVRVVRTATGRRDLPVRGFFLIPYTSKTPPKACR
jgi:hypothetical protein